MSFNQNADRKLSVVDDPSTDAPKLDGDELLGVLGNLPSGVNFLQNIGTVKTFLAQKATEFFQQIFLPDKRRQIEYFGVKATMAEIKSSFLKELQAVMNGFTTTLLGAKQEKLTAYWSQLCSTASADFHALARLLSVINVLRIRHEQRNQMTSVLPKKETLLVNHDKYAGELLATKTAECKSPGEAIAHSFEALANMIRSAKNEADLTRALQRGESLLTASIKRFGHKNSAARAALLLAELCLGALYFEAGEQAGQLGLPQADGLQQKSLRITSRVLPGPKTFANSEAQPSVTYQTQSFEEVSSRFARELGDLLHYLESDSASAPQIITAALPSWQKALTHFDAQLGRRDAIRQTRSETRSLFSRALGAFQDGWRRLTGGEAQRPADSFAAT
jgi:hypothetical protein